MKSFAAKGLTAVLVWAFLLWGISAAAYAEENTETYVSGTKINGVGVAGLTPEEAAARLKEFYSGGYALTITGKDGAEAVVSGTDIGYQAVPEGLEEILAAENAAGRMAGPSVDNSYEAALTVSYDSQALAARLASLPLVAEAVPTSDAYIAPWDEEKGFVIVPESEGTEIDLEMLTAAAEAALKAGEPALDLESAGCYREILTRAADESLIRLKDAMNRCASMEVTCQAGSRAVTLEGKEIAGWLTAGADGAVAVDRSRAAAWVAEMAAEFDTAGTARTFHTAGGADVTLTGPYGWKVDQEAETDALIAAIQAGESVTREPVWSSAAASHDGNDYGNTYVEVDMGNQHVYFFQDGQLVWDAPCVTGNLSKHYDTPEGIYGLYYKQQDKVLRGAKRADGTYEYESPVKYWMPFNGGIGLHDADWRSGFGGTIYKTNGSHGCVNLPPSKTKELYDYLYKNVPVICHS